MHLAEFSFFVFSAKDDSVVLKKSIQEFVDVAKKGHVAALIFTHIDVFQEKYHTEGIPIDISGKFEGNICTACR